MDKSFSAVSASIAAETMTVATAGYIVTPPILDASDNAHKIRYRAGQPETGDLETGMEISTTDVFSRTTWHRTQATLTNQRQPALVARHQETAFNKSAPEDM